jgi:predicted TIM-barrel fold metal-dependent hydrolase
MKDGFRIFDTHTHIARHSGRVCSAEDMLRHMDRFGIDRSVAIPVDVVDDWRAAHEEIGAAVRAHPDRLCGAAGLDTFVAEPTFRDEVRRCREKYGFVALKLQPRFQGLNPFSRRSDFFFETVLENWMAVICHRGSGLPFAAPSLMMVPAAAFCPNMYLELSSLRPHHLLEVLAEVPASRLMIESDLPQSTGTEIGTILWGAAARLFKGAE